MTSSLSKFRKAFWRKLLFGLVLPGFALIASPSLAEPLPGDACSTSGTYIRSGGPEVAGGGHFLVCDGTEWQSVLDYSGTSRRVDFDIANDTGPCTAAKTGRLRYDEATDELTYCDGSDPWKVLATGAPAASPDCADDSAITCTLDATRSDDDPHFVAANIKNGVNILGVMGTYVGGVGGGNGGCTHDPTCPNVGDVCSGDGSGGGNPKFAGCVCYHDANSADNNKCMPLYVTQADQSTSVRWKTSAGGNDVATDSLEDGKINDGQLANSASFPAAKLCKDLTDGGYSDWYVPAETEGELLWRNRAALGLGATSFWSSSEDGIYQLYYQMSDSSGYSMPYDKNLYQGVRCVRRD